MLHFHRSRFLHLCGVGGKHTGYFRIQVLGRNLFPCGRLGLEKRNPALTETFPVCADAPMNATEQNRMNRIFFMAYLFME